MNLYLSDIGIVNALGANRTDVLAGLLAGDASGMVAHGPLLTGRRTVVGRVDCDLPTLPAALAAFDCRNNRLLAAALEQIAPTVRDLRERIGPRRIGVVLGTSTSGIAAGEDAAESRARAGRNPPGYHYRQQEIGTVAGSLRVISAPPARATRSRLPARRRRKHSRRRAVSCSRAAATPSSSAAPTASVG